MPNGFGRGRGFSRSFGGGMGFGFRGSSPPWPYVGIGRGGLPRCGYFLSGAGVPYSAPGYAPFMTHMTEEYELSHLKGQAEAIKGQLEEIETRIRDIENKQKKG
jgi:hypothetical protein